MKGTGLGLFIVRSIARNHGGKVFAESEGSGKGTTVTLELPRLLADQAAAGTGEFGFAIDTCEASDTACDSTL